MKLEQIALWDEKDLFSEQAVCDSRNGAVAQIRGCFASSCIFEAMGEDRREVRAEADELIDFLKNEDAAFLLRSEKDMTRYCQDKLRDHVPYSFNRECFGFRVLTDSFAWYIACTPWNERRQYSIFGYDRRSLMTYLASLRGLPESCYGVLRYTGERIRIRFGAFGFESFPQYGGNMEANRAYADERNQPKGITREQVAAMEGGAVFGWDTPAADVQNYDSEGRYIPPERVAVSLPKGAKRRK